MRSSTSCKRRKTKKRGHGAKTKEGRIQDQKTISKATAIKESLQCAELAEIKGIEKSVTRANYFIGSKDNWRTEIPTWKGVSLGKVYKGIELNLKAYGDNVEKLFTVYPEGKVSDIRVKTEGAKGIKVNKAGELEIETGLGTVKMTRPVAYQEIDGKRVQVAANYTLSEKSGNSYGFRVGEYDRARPLVIDPLLASTFVGGSSDDYVGAIAIDSSGNVIIAGSTRSIDYPVTEGAYDTTHNGGVDAMISKLDSDLSNLLSSTLIGGSVSDVANALAIDSTGNVIIAGNTISPDYPTTEGAFDTVLDGFRDVFISKLDNNLSGSPLVIDIKANSSDGPITITHHDTVSITVALSPGSRDGEDADWFVLQNTDSGWYHYVNATKSWEPGIEVSFQGPLFEVETRNLWEGSIKGTGSYRFHFAVDMNMNGEMDKDLLYFDRVVVDVAN